jgi:hypothetical protein
MFFDLKKLTQQGKGDPVLMLKMLENYYLKRLPKNKKDMKNFSRVNLHGDSFIENPDQLFSFKTDPVYKVQYLILASKRDFLLLKVYGARDLDLSYYPDLNTAALKGNPLVTVTPKLIKFNI